MILSWIIKTSVSHLPLTVVRHVSAKEYKTSCMFQTRIFLYLRIKKSLIFLQSPHDFATQGLSLQKKIFEWVGAHIHWALVVVRAVQLHSSSRCLIPVTSDFRIMSARSSNRGHDLYITPSKETSKLALNIKLHHIGVDKTSFDFNIQRFWTWNGCYDLETRCVLITKSRRASRFGQEFFFEDTRMQVKVRNFSTIFIFFQLLLKKLIQKRISRRALYEHSLW